MFTQQDKDFFYQACKNIISCPKANGYAKTYAKAGLEFTTPEQIQAQLPYLLGNISSWRGDRAVATRMALKKLGAL